MVIISDTNSPLILKAKKEKLLYLTIPEKVGGRFSVFSAVGLFPLAVAGIDIKKLRKGANKAMEYCLSKSLSNNIAAASAIFQYYYFKKGKIISDTFIYNPELEFFGKWYRQLIAESIGKEKNKKGKIVNAGITPIVTIGPADLHSVGQLYIGVPKDKMTTFITTSEYNNGTPIPSKCFLNTVENISGKTLSDITSIIQRSVINVYTKFRLPYLILEMNDISEESLGELLQMKMIEIMYLGHLIGVNAFDQPQVELYKREMDSLLSKNN